MQALVVRRVLSSSLLGSSSFLDSYFQFVTRTSQFILFLFEFRMNLILRCCHIDLLAWHLNTICQMRSGPWGPMLIIKSLLIKTSPKN